jgi:hypothetical protein
MSKPLETTLCLNTFNRDVSIYPEPNDFVLDLKGRYEVQFAVVGNLELPLTQYTIEEEWNSFGFDVGSSLADIACRSISVFFPGRKHTEQALVLPAPWLQVLGNNNLWTSIEAHGLTPTSLKLLGANVLQPGALLQPEEVVAVIDEFTVSTRGSSGSSSGYGLLQVQSAGVRSFATPRHLADVLSASFSDLGWPLRVSFDTQSATAELLAPLGTVIYVSEQFMLLPALGFPCCRGSVNTFPLSSDNFPVGARIAVSLEPGHYDPSAFRSRVEALMNPLSQCGVVPTSMFAVERWSFAPVAVMVPLTRSFHPRGIAVALTSMLALAGLQSIKVSFAADSFSFSSDDGVPFVVIWGQGQADLDLASRLGFDPSATALAQNATGSPCYFHEIPTSISLPLAFMGTSINTERKFVFSPRPRVQRETLGAVQAVSDGVELWVPVGDLPLEYVVLVGGIFAVSQQVLGARTVLRCFGPVPAPGTYSTQLVPVLTAALTLYYLLPPKTCFSKMAEITGFPGGTTSVMTTSGALIAPNAWNFEQPPYLLIELGLQHMSALISHRCNDDIKSQIMGRFSLFPNFKLDRGSQIQKSGTGVSYVTTLKMQIFNPWHSLYQFHGRDWSMTLILGSAQRTAHTECP